MKDNSPLEATAANGYNESAIHKTGKYTISVKWNASVTSLDNKKAAANTYNFELKGEGNVVLLTENDASKAVTTNKVTITITVDDSGDVAVTTGDLGYYAIRTNNDSGAEYTSDAGLPEGKYLHTADKLSIASTNI